MRHVAPLRLLTALVLGATPAAPAAAQTLSFQQNIVGPSQTQFGNAIAVDGTTAVIGARLENGSRGAVYVVVRSGSTWSLQQRLEASDATGSARFGSSVAISGNTIVVGAPSARTGGVPVGGAYVFTRTGTTWTQTNKLVASDGTENAFFGTEVAVDGTRVIAGAPSALVSGVQTGAAYIYEWSGAAWAEQKLIAPQRDANDNFGISVGVSGTSVCVGASGYDVGASLSQGAAYVFTRGASWTLQQLLTATDGLSSDALGGSCAIDGDTVAVGAIGVAVAGQTAVGAVYPFHRSGGTWTQQPRLTRDFANGGFVPLGLRGDVLVAGASTDNGLEGGAYVFRRTGSTWSRFQRIGNAGEVLGRLFGSGVATDGTSVLAGVPQPSATSGSPGNTVSVYTFATGQPAGAPGAPSSFAATVAGNTVNMSWSVPSSGGAPTGYTLIARSPGGAVLVSVPLGLVTSFAASAPNGTYVLSMRASNAAGNGPESAPVTVVLPASVAPPGAPSGLTGAVAGNTAVFTWNPPASGGAVTNYLLVAGTSPGFAVPIASVTLAGTPGVSIPGVPAGTFYVRVLALNNGGTSPASNEVSITVAGPTPPGVPTLNPAVVSGSTVTLSWTPGTGAATSYTLRAYSASGVSLVTVPGLTGTTVAFSGVPSGSYELELLGVNAAGTSAPSARITLTVP